MKGSKTFLGEARGLGPECALSLGRGGPPPLPPLPCTHEGGGGGGPAPSQEALGVGRACGNDFIGKACDIFSPPVCGSWRKLEVVVISVALAEQEPSRGTRLSLPAAPLRPSRHAWGLLAALAHLPPRTPLPPPRSTLSKT